MPTDLPNFFGDVSGNKELFTPYITTFYFITSEFSYLHVWYDSFVE